MSAPQPIVPTPLGAASLTLFAWAITLFGTALASGAEGSISLAIGLCLGFGGVGTMAARSVPPPSDLRLGLHGFRPRFLVPMLLMAPAIVLASEIDNWVPALLPPHAPAADAAKAAADSEIGQLETLEAIITMLLLRPVLEEFFFRGVIQQGLVAHLGTLGGVVQTALLSGVAAGGIFLILVPNIAASTAAQAAFMALLYGVLRYASGSLLASILASLGYGLLGLAATQLIEVPGFTSGEDVHTPLWIVLASAMPVAAGVALALLWREERGMPPLAPPPAPSSMP